MSRNPLEIDNFVVMQKETIHEFMNIFINQEVFLLVMCFVY